MEMVRVKRKFLLFLIFLLAVGWLFSGWPQIWKNPPIPPEVKTAQLAGEEGLKVSMAIQVKDENGAGAKQGDIIAIKPAGSEWSKAVKINNLILEVDLGNTITTWEDAQKLTVPIFETGELWWPEEIPKIIGERRYQINFDDLKKKAKNKGIALDYSKIVDLKDKANFQRLEKITFNFDDLIQDKVSNKKLKSADLKIIKDIGK